MGKNLSEFIASRSDKFVDNSSDTNVEKELVPDENGEVIVDGKRFILTENKELIPKDTGVQVGEYVIDTDNAPEDFKKMLGKLDDINSEAEKAKKEALESIETGEVPAENGKAWSDVHTTEEEEKLEKGEEIEKPASIMTVQSELDEEEEDSIIDKYLKGENLDEPEEDDDGQDSIDEFIRKRDEEYTEPDSPNTEASQSAALAFEMVDNEEYKQQMLSVIDSNKVLFKKTNKVYTENAVKRFTNRGKHMSVPLLNSGMFVTVAGGGINDIIANQTMSGASKLVMTLRKLEYLHEKIIDTSIGKISFDQMTKLISFHDLGTMYFGLFGATFPNENDFPLNCPKCKAMNALKVHTADLVLNADKFKNVTEYISNEVETVADLTAASKVSKLKQYKLGDIYVYYRHPSIYDWLKVTKQLTPALRQKYGDYICILAINFPYLAIPDGKKYVRAVEIKDILSTLSSLRPVELKLLSKIIKDNDDNVENIQYGFKGYTCSSCKEHIDDVPTEMEQLLFMNAQVQQVLIEKQLELEEENEEIPQLTLIAQS